MKKVFYLFSFGAILFFAQAICAQKQWSTYTNARYGFSISYPSDLLAPQPEADNSDGRIFSNDSAEMRVYGSQMLLRETLRAEFDALVKEHDDVSYRLFRPNFFVVSGTENGRIFYQKTVARKDGTFVTFYIEYANAERDAYDKITAKIARSLK